MDSANGLTWLSLWTTPCEGPYTRTSKLAIANVMAPSIIQGLIFTLPVSREARGGRQRNLGVHARSFLVNGWMSKLGSASESGFLREVASTTLNNVLGGWATRIAGDEYFRYCPTCLSLGFQSSFCQIDALIRCPVHGDTLLAVCRACNSPTPRYALDNSFRAPMRCVECSQFLADCWLPPSAFHQWRCIEAARGYDALAQALRPLSSAHWYDSTSWDAELSLASVSERRVVEFSFVRKILYLKLDDRLFDLRFWPPVPPIFRAFPNKLYYPDAATVSDRSIIYKSFYKRLADKLRVTLVPRARAIQRCIKIPYGDSVFEAKGIKNPKLLAYCLFRHRFERNPSLVRVDIEPVIRPAMISWPLGILVSDNDWTTLLEVCYKVLLKFSEKWCRETKGMTRKDVAWRTKVNEYRNALTPASHPFPLGIGFLSFGSGGEREIPLLAIANASLALSALRKSAEKVSQDLILQCGGAESASARLERKSAVALMRSSRADPV